MFVQLPDLNGKSPKESIEIIEGFLRSNQEMLEYVLTHLDSSNILEIDISKTKIYKGEENELR